MTEQSAHRHTPAWRTVFEVSSTALMLILASVLVWQNRAGARTSDAAGATRGQATVPKKPIDIGDSPVLGGPSARVAIVEYADFQCPACAEFARSVEPALRRDYVDKGSVVFVYKHFPLPVHPRATVAAAAGWCAARQGRFWQVHDLLFASPAQLDDLQLQSAAQRSGLDLVAYSSCRIGPEATRQVQMEGSDGYALGVSATPTFFIGKITQDRRVQVSNAILGGAPMTTFKTFLDRLME